MKNILASSLTHHLTNQKLICLEEFGFREGRFVSDLRICLTAEWQDALNQRDDIIIVALDKSGLSNKVRHSRLLAKLKATVFYVPFLAVCR